MKPLRIFTHVACEPPGYLSILLEQKNIPFEQVCLFDDIEVPTQMDDVSGLIFMGGAGNVNEPTAWMKQEMKLIQQAQSMGVPMFGICLGAQLMSKALGGKVWETDELEVGWHQVTLLPDKKSHPWLQSLPLEFNAFHWHAHSFTAPRDAMSIASSDCTPCQGFILENTLALQFHVEMTPDIIRGILEKYTSDLGKPSQCVQSEQEILQDIEEKCLSVFKVADELISAWLTGVIPDLTVP